VPIIVGEGDEDADESENISEISNAAGTFMRCALAQAFG
jgi:hypothetical protein